MTQPSLVSTQERKKKGRGISEKPEKDTDNADGSDSMPKARPGLCQSSLGRNLELLGWRGKTGLPDSKRGARTVEKS